VVISAVLRVLDVLTQPELYKVGVFFFTFYRKRNWDLVSLHNLLSKFTLCIENQRRSWLVNSGIFSPVLGMLLRHCLYLFRRAALNKYHILGYIKQQKLIFSWFWRLGVWNQRVGRPCSSEGVSQDSVFTSSYFLEVYIYPWTNCKCIPLMWSSTFTWAFPVSFLCLFFFPYKNSYIGLETHWNDLTLIWLYLLILFQNKVTFTGTWLELEHIIL
jgi:hypothetical protein